MTITKHDVEKCIHYLKEQEDTYKGSYGKNDRKAQAYKEAAEYLESYLLPKVKTDKKLVTV